jgi:hypothetical protein
MKLTNFDNPVMSSWFAIKGARLDSKPYLSGALEARVLLEKLRAEKQLLREVTTGIYHAGREGRTYVDNSEYGVPFLGSTDILAADLSSLPFLSKKQVMANPLFVLQEGWTLITRSGTVGRMAFVRPDMAGMACSEHVMRVVPDPDKIRPGYLYAYLSSKFGVPQVTEGTYGAIIQHLEPSHIKGLDVPRLGDDVEEAAHHNITKAAHLRSEYQVQVKAATEMLFSSVGLQDITAQEWHSMGPDLGFPQYISLPGTLRAVNFNPRLQKLVTSLSSTSHMLLGDICKGGILRRGMRFKRIDCEPEMGVKLVGQKELFWLEPEGRWIAPQHTPGDVFVNNETILIAAQGTLGEREVFCRAELITGSWLQYAYTEHLLRVQSGKPSISGAFLFAFLRSETVFRYLRSIIVGSKQQDFHRLLLAQLPVPIPSETTRSDIENLIRTAFKKRHEASQLEKVAVEMVETAIEGSAKWQPLSR